MFRLSLKSVPMNRKGEACLQIVELLRKHIPNDLIVTEISNKLVQAGENLITSLGPKNEIEITRQLRELDDERDDAFRALVYGLQMHTHLPHEENKIKAKSILDNLLIDNMGFLNKADLAESSILTEKITYLEKEENLTFINELNMNLSLETLKATNEKFNDIYHHRISEKTNRPTPVTITTYPLDNLLRSTYYYLKGINFDKDLSKLIFEPIIKAKKSKQKPEEPVV
jgi:Family of unknown function (DUF6261)